MMNDVIQILLVDDEPRFCESLSPILSSSGFQVTTAASGNEAVGILAGRKFDVLLLDVELPDMPGYQIMDCLQGENSNAATIMLTGHTTVETAVQSLKKGAYDYLKKPVDHDQLFNTIDKALRHSHLERALKHSEERSRILAEASWEGIVIHANGLLLDANQQFFEMFGYQADELFGHQILDKILSVDSIPDVSLRIKSNTFGFHEATGVRKDGTEFPIETNSRHLEYQGKNARVCAIRDISERVNAQQEKQELQKQLAIAHKMETLGLMAGSVAHDLNNILSGLVTMPELLLLQIGKENEHRGTIKIIQEAGKEAASVVSDLITVARGATAEKKVCNMNALIKKYVESSIDTAMDPRLKGIELKVNVASNLANSYCSAVHIKKVLMNLIGNAAEAMEGKGTIEIRTENVLLKQPVQGYEQIAAGDYVVVMVMDDGPGINQKDIQKIFEPFYSKKIMGRSGTGLGLSIVWNTVHDHDGYIDLRSDGNGTIFTLYFPTTTEVVAENDVVQSLEQHRGYGEKILVVDDQKKQQEIATSLLDGLGYCTNVVGSGEEAVAYVKQHPVDLVVLDMIMENGINGRETYEEILKVNPEQRALIASGFAVNDEVKQTLLLGASRFVKKPYTLNQMGQAVKKALDGGGCFRT